jgi:nucleotide-binding universal stress UspA family protein
MPNDKVKFLVCVNGTKNSAIALRVACKKAKGSGASLEMLRAIDIDQQTFLSVTDTVRQEKRAEAENMMQEYLRNAHEYANISIEYKIEEGLATEAIIKTVEQDSRIGMIVLGAPTKVSESIIPALLAKLDNCLMVPLMIVPGTLTDQQILDIE